MRRMLTAVLMVGGLVHAAITSPSATAVLVSMHGPGGLNIEGKTAELSISEQDGDLLFQVPLAGVDTGIGLRNKHMRGYLDVTHFPTAELRVARKAIAFPEQGKVSEADAAGTLTLHGVSRPCSVHYRAERTASGEVRVRGTTRFDMQDFAIDVPAYLGVHVDPAVGIQVDFSLRDV